MSDETVLDSSVPTVELPEAIRERDASTCARLISEMPAGDAAHVLSGLSDSERSDLLGLLDAETSAQVLEHLPEPQVLGAVESLSPAIAARIIEELPSDAQADLIATLDAEDAEAILTEISAEEAGEIRRMAAYAPDTAGGLMVSEFLRFPRDWTVRQVIEDLGEHAEEYADYDIQYAYVVDDLGGLVGVLRMRDLLLSRRADAIASRMIEAPISVADEMPLDELEALFDEHRFFGFPVVDERGQLVGVVHRTAVENALAESAESDFRRSQGIIGGEELRSMPLRVRSGRRLAWLSVNIVLNVVAASVIAMHQDTLEAVIALAVFLPIISDMSGCSGNQAVAVSMREMTLGVTRPGDFLRVLRKELSVGAVNGLVLGALIGTLALIWKGNIALGLVVGAALMVNTVVAVGIGGCVPLVLKKFKKDPALASGPILTTVTDMCGFFLVLTLAALALPYLIGV